MERFKNSIKVDERVKIYPFTERYIMDLVEISEVSTSYPWCEKIFLDCLKNQYFGWVLEFNYQPIGFIIILLQQDECHLMNIAVRPEFQRKKFAEYLLVRSIDFARMNLASRILLEVRVTNEAAINFFKKMGAVNIGIRKNYYPSRNGQREDAKVFVFNL